MPSITLHVSDTSRSKSHPFDEAIYVVENDGDKLSISEMSDEKVLSAIIKGQNGYYLFKDLIYGKDTDVLVNGDVVQTFIRLESIPASINVWHLNREYKFNLEFEKQPTCKPETTHCMYCWSEFKEGENAVLIQGDEYHLSCAREIQLSEKSKESINDERR